MKVTVLPERRSGRTKCVNDAGCTHVTFDERHNAAFDISLAPVKKKQWCCSKPPTSEWP